MTTAATTTLFRPTGVRELQLIHDSGMKTFPPRLPEQPIFYPVMNREYAQQIAQEWNAPSSPDYIGFVLEFDVDSTYLEKFEIQTVGAKRHQELWVPAEELGEFNKRIVRTIRVIDVYRDERCQIELDDELRIPKDWLNVKKT